MAKKDPNEMSFLDHVEALRWHLIRSTVAVVLVAIVAFMAKDFIFDVVIFGPKKADFPTYKLFCRLSQTLGLDKSFCTQELPFRVQSRIMSGQFSAHIWTSIWAGFIIAFPYILYELWRFVSPGLYTSERRNAKGFIIIASLLFFTGVLFGYYLIAPLSINFLATYTVSGEVFNDIDLGSYIATVRAAVISCGLIFELPILIYFFTKIGILTSKIMKKYRKFALVIVLIHSAFITPPDIASHIVVATPILILYEVRIYITKFVLKIEARKAKKYEGSHKRIQ
ncbi:MAG: twin-arginine translocase subunit TatC [Sinomicrobium sp.]|nr:twin-arginine translocase subunit TatC [Sinomicrobium sp.]